MGPAPMNKVNNKKSLFVCFRPAACTVDDDTFRAQKRGGATDPVLEYLAFADEDGLVSSSAGVEGGRRRRKNGRDRWRAFRTAIIDTAMMKKISRRRKSNKDTNSSMSRSSSSTFEGKATTNKTPNPKPKTSSTNNSISNASSTLSSSSSAAFTPSSTSSLSSSSSLRSTDHVSAASSSHEICSPPLNNGSGATVKLHIKQCAGFEDRRKGCCRCSNTVLCMFLVSLLVLILWGKFVAILCTSTWFYLVRPSRRRPISSNKEGEGNEFDSNQYKKKIIMEGLLDRSHCRVVAS